MKTLSLLSATTLATVLLSWPARADEPQALKLAPEIRAMLSELLKSADADPAADPAPAKPSANPTPATPAPAPTASSSSTAPRTNGTGAGPHQPATGLRTSSLQASGLRTSSLMTSAPLGGHGLTGGAPRLTNDEWRDQFPVRK